jgi:hypothetical protein
MSSVVNRTYSEGLEKLDDEGEKEAVKTTLGIIKKLWGMTGVVRFLSKLPSQSLEDKNAIIYVAARKDLWAKVCSELSKTWNGSHTQLCRFPKNIIQQILYGIAIGGVHYHELEGEITAMYDNDDEEGFFVEFKPYDKYTFLFFW